MSLEAAYLLTCDSCGNHKLVLNGNDDWHPQDAITQAQTQGWSAHQDRLHCNRCLPLCSRCGTECSLETYCPRCGDARGTR